MDSEGCWSTVVSSAAERRALGLPESAGWMLECRLSGGHRGNHATDGSLGPRGDRRLWLEWNDFDPRAQSLIERNPCPVHSAENAPCRYFYGHPGLHVYARSNGHAPSAMSGMAAGGHGHAPAGPHTTSPAPGPEYSTTRGGTHGPSTGDLPVSGVGARGSHRMPETSQSEARQPEIRRPETPPPPAAPTGESYRGGRRSTDSTPPGDLPAYRGRRHSFDVPAPAPEPLSAPAQTPRTPPQAPAPEPAPPTSAPAALEPAASEPAASEPAARDHTVEPTAPLPAPSPDVSAGRGGLGTVGDALDDVASALSKLAEALRRR
ncbi:hypothetical protein ACPXB3_09275 [Gordonia sp. DT219]|uniref:hypothetical protein n=1 Tax=Gordonia sp. DT219 TaxID=3416658 RepID=UPI003CF144F3